MSGSYEEIGQRQVPEALCQLALEVFIIMPKLAEHQFFRCGELEGNSVVGGVQFIDVPQGDIACLFGNPFEPQAFIIQDETGLSAGALLAGLIKQGIMRVKLHDHRLLFGCFQGCCSGASMSASFKL